jgi:serine/threonine-protein kinase
MSPEQARGEVEAVGPATDIWALGVVLYELLAGTSPFAGETVMTTLGNIVSDVPIPPAATHRADVPALLEAIAARCLERDLHSRYPSAAALADDLAAYLAGRPLPSGAGAPRPGLLKRLFRRE